MQTWLNKFLNVRSNEWSRLFLLAGILILCNVGANWGMNIAYAAFLKQAGLRAGLETLIWVLLLGSILSIPALAIYSAFVDRINNNLLFNQIVIGGGLIILLGIALLKLNFPNLAFPLLYVFSTAWMAVFNQHFFTYVNELYDIQSAKRTLPLILGAGRAGAALAGFTLTFLTSAVSPEVIIWIWLLCDALMVGVIFAVPFFVQEQKKLAESIKATAPAQKSGTSYLQNLQEGLNFTLQSGFLRRMAIGTLLLMALFSLMEYQVNKTLTPLFASTAEYAGFLGLLDGVTNLIALFILFFGIGRVTKFWGVGNASLVFPASTLLICGFLVGFPVLGIGGIPLVLAAAAAHLDRKGLRFSLREPIDALLYNAIPFRIKGRARAFVGGLIAPVGAIGGVLLLVVELWYGSIIPWWIPALISVLSLSYLVNAFVVRNQYTQALVKMLEQEDYSFLVSEDASDLAIADPATLQRLQKKLKESTSHEMKVFMTQLIAQVGGAESLSMLIPAIKEAGDVRTRAAMLNVLAAAGLRGNKMQGLYVEYLTDVDAQVRLAAASGLEQMLGANDPWLQGKLLGMVNDPDTQVSLYALQSLTNTGEFYKFDVAVRKLDKLLNSDLVEHKKDAIDILGKIANPQAIEQILAFLDNENDQLRLEAILKLENLTLPFGNALDSKILEKVRPLWQDPMARVRQAMLQVLGKFKNKADYASLISAMTDKSPQVRAMAVDVLVGIGKDVAPLIQAELKIPDSQAQNMAAVALSRIHPQQYATLIETKVSDNLNKIYQNISLEQTLSTYIKHRSVRVLLAGLREINREQINEILYLLSAIHTPEILKVVKDSLDSELPSTRNLALEALESLTSPRVAALIASLFEPSMDAAQLLQIGRDSLNIEQLDLTQTFEKLLAPTETRILSLLALHALGDICGTELSPAPKRPISKAARLLETFESPIEQVEAAPALSPELRFLLEKTLSNAEPLMQQSAQIALQKIENAQAEIQTGGTILAAPQEPGLISMVERVIILKEVSFFRSVSITQLETLAMVCEQKKYEKDTQIFKKGDPGGVLFIVVDGKVGIEQEKRIGSALLATIENGSYFGEMSLFDNSPRSASAIAITDCFVLELNRAPIIMLTMQNPDLALELINVLSQRIRETSDRVAETARSRPRELHKLYDQFET